jgi:hypothetical protein
MRPWYAPVRLRLHLCRRGVHYEPERLALCILAPRSILNKLPLTAVVLVSQ